MDINGVYCRTNKTFYYLECGNFFVSHSTETILNRLEMKELLPPALKPGDQPGWKPMTLAAAQEQEIKVEVMYLNKHVEEVCKSSGNTGKTRSAWS